MQKQGLLEVFEPQFTCRACRQVSDDGQVSTQQVRCNVRQFKSSSFPLWQCQHCDSINVLGQQPMDEYYSGYPFQDVKLNFTYKWAYNRRISQLKKYGLKKTSRILDYGCGGGAFVRWLKSKGYKLSFGFDKYSEVYSDASTLKQKYDFIISYDVIEHFEDPGEFINQVNACLNPKGTLVVGTPNSEGIDLKNPEAYLMELHPPYHRVILSSHALTGLALREKLVPIDSFLDFYLNLVIPFHNYKFIQNYVRKTGGFVDVATEPPNLRTVMSSPWLVFLGFLGFLYPVKTNINMVFKKP